MAQTQVGDYWTGLRDNLTGLVLDYGRSKLIDVEDRRTDDNIPDRADIQAGTAQQASQDALGGAMYAKRGGLTAGQWALVGVGVLGAAVLIKRML